MNYLCFQSLAIVVFDRVYSMFDWYPHIFGQRSTDWVISYH